ncbi:hypothetical protein CVS40_11892 [Lucilia cuprina]|nr:hypothetical protein CVS40_11892 [Lucilia cuprina]
MLKIKNKSGQYVLARALLDSGSQINFKQERNLSLIGIGRTNSSAKYKLQATVKSRIPQRSDMLIASEIFFELLCVGQIKLNPNIPTLQKTHLGWVDSGKYKELKHFNKNLCHLSTLNENEDSLDSIVRRFWELEEIPREANVLTLEHRECEKNFMKSGYRLKRIQIHWVSLLKQLREDSCRYNVGCQNNHNGVELYSTLLRFRMHKYDIRADIEKMYRQVLIYEADRNYNLILWREDQSQNLEIYKLNTVTYGTSSAPFSAIRCLTYLSELFEKSLPIGSKVVKRDFYVDDLLTGADSIEDLNIIRSQVTLI